jgi:tetratricopeptide (TPR) repeat protein
MPRHHRTAAASLALAAALLLGSVGFAQSSPRRVVMLPFDATRSVETLGLATPGALQRAFNQIDGLFVPPVGDALALLQRATQAGSDPLAEIDRLFQADAIVLGRITGTSTLEVELIVSVDGDDRSETIRGALNDLPALWRQIAERTLALAGITVGAADLAEVRDVLATAPETAALGPLGIATARLPAVRLDDLETAISLGGAGAWLLAETARVAAIEGSIARAVTLAQQASSAAPTHADVRVVEAIVKGAAGDRAGSEAAFRAALATNPSHAVALAGLAPFVSDGGERVLLIERALSASPRLVDAHVALASLQTAPQRRLQVLRRAVERVPDSAVLHRALLEAVLETGDARGALELLREATRDPLAASPQLYALAASLPAALRPEVVSLLREGRERFPNASVLALAESDVLIADGQLAGAEAALRDALRNNPADVVVASELATVLARQGRIDDARAVLLALDTRGGGLEVRLLELELAAGRARVVLEELAPRIAAGERDLALRTLYGVALGRVGRTDEARRVLEGVVAEDAGAEVAARSLEVLAEQRLIGTDADLRLEGEAAEAFEQGLYALELGQYAAAAAAFARARSLGDAGLLAFYEGYALQGQGDVRGAIRAYGAARLTLGDNDVLLNNLGFAQLQVGRLDLALEALRAAVAANEQNAQAQLNLGLTYYQLGNFAEAVARFDRAVALAPELEAAAATFIADARRRLAP